MKTNFTHSYYSWYLIEDKDGNVLVEYKNAVCFSAVSYQSLPEGSYKFVLKVPYSITPFGLKEIEKYYKLMDRLGFPMHVEFDKENNQFICFLFIDDYDNNRLKFNSAITILRYVSHSPFQRIVYQFITGKTPRAKAKLFEKFEKAHSFVGKFDAPFSNESKGYGGFEHMGNTNHSLKTQGTVLGMDVIMERIDKCKVKLNNYGVSINGTWT